MEPSQFTSDSTCTTLMAVCDSSHCRDIKGHLHLVYTEQETKIHRNLCQKDSQGPGSGVHVFECSRKGGTSGYCKCRVTHDGAGLDGLKPGGWWRSLPVCKLRPSVGTLEHSCVLGDDTDIDEFRKHPLHAAGVNRLQGMPTKPQP